MENTIIKFDEGVVAKFDANKLELTKIVDEAKKIVCTDLLDKLQLAVVKSTRLNLRRCEIAIEKRGKEVREDAKLFIDGVINYEKELKSLSTPEIERLEKIEEDAKRAQLVEERKLLIPDRRQKISDISKDIVITDEQLLEMDGPDFQNFLNVSMSKKLEKERIEFEAQKKAEQDKIDAENNRIRIENERIEAEAAAKRKIEQDKIDAENKRIQAEKDAIEAEKKRIAHEEEVKKAAEEAKIKAEQELKDKLERERLAEEKRIADEKEAERLRLEALPDKQMVGEYVRMVLSIIPPKLKTKEYQNKLSKLIESLNDICSPFKLN